MPFSVTILGSSSALPTSTRFPSAHVLNAHERLFLIDCAEGTQVQLRKFRCKLSRINHIFISHLHGDHTLGLVGLISTFNLLGRKNELHIFAHEPLEPILNVNLNFFVNDLGFPINFHPIKTRQKGLLYSDHDIDVEVFPLKHRIPSSGFLFREKPKDPNIRKELVSKFNISIGDIVRIKGGEDLVLPNGDVIPNNELTFNATTPRSYAYCSDTMFFDSLAERVSGVDLLYHEATFGNRMEKLARQTGHSTAKQAAITAFNANAGKLVIGHFSSRYKNVEVLLNEAREIFPETYLAEDGLIFNVADKREE